MQLSLILERFLLLLSESAINWSKVYKPNAQTLTVYNTRNVK